MASVLYSSLLLILLGISSYVSSVTVLSGVDCKTCPTDNEERECVFLWPVEWEVSYNSENCGSCPNTLSDCSNEGCIPLDGISRAIITTVGMMPGPTVEVCKNDRVKIIIQNQLTAGETIGIHWHGQHMENQPFMDGVPMVTQCGILPWTNFTYDFYPTTVGTHFWHSHSGIQRADGLFGAFIVREKNDPHASRYDYDLSEHVIEVFDWYEQIAAYRSIDGQSASSLLFNGFGRTSGGQPMPRAEFYVDTGNKYRFRVINSGFSCPFEISIDDHTLQVIAVDGNNVEPYEVDIIGLFLAERVDFVLTADQATESEQEDFEIKVWSTCSSPTLTGLAFLRYNTDGNEAPPTNDDTFEKPTGVTLNPLSLTGSDNEVPIVDLNSTVEQSYEGIPSSRYYLHIGLIGSPNINNVKFLIPQAPLLTQHDDVPTLCLDTPKSSETTGSCSGGLCHCTHYMHWGLEDDIELVLFSSRGTHPMHMHGYYYSVIGQGLLPTIPDGQEYTNEKVVQWDKEDELSRSKITYPPNKDTIAVHNGAYVIIRIFAKNPGWWIFHCHIDFHLERGMAMVIRTGEEGDLPDRPPGDWPVCNSYPTGSGDSSPPVVFTSPETEANCQPMLIAVIIGWVVAAILLIIVVYLVITRNSS